MLLDNPFWPDPRVLCEAEALTGRGHEVTIYAWDRDCEIERPARERLEDIEIIRIPVKSKRQLGLRQIPYYLMYAWRVFWLVMQGKFDAVHCHDLPNLPIGILLKLFRRVRLIYDAHEIYWTMEAHKYSPFVLSLLRRGEIILLRWVDVFITVGAVRSEYYQRYYKKTIHIVGNWHNRKLPDRRLGADLRRRLGVPEDAFVLTFAGTLGLDKSADVLVDCAQRLRSETQPIHWLIAGMGPAEPVFQRAVGQNPNLHFLGWVEDTVPLYSATDALIYLLDLSHSFSKYSSPHHLFVSIAWALPMITLAAGEIGTLLVPEKTGLLIEKADTDTVCSAIRRLSEEPGLYERIVKNLKDLQDVYSWESAAECLCSAYEQSTHSVAG